MVFPQGQVLVGPLYWLLLVLLMCALYLMGGTELKGFEITSYAPVVRQSRVCDVAYFSIIGDLLANLDFDFCAWNLIAANAHVFCCEAGSSFDHYLIALAAERNVEGYLKCVGVFYHMGIIPSGGDSMRELFFLS